MIYKENRDLLVFGDNKCGQLGLDDIINRNKPTLLNNDENIRMISCINDYSLIFKQNGNLLGCGDLEIFEEKYCELKHGQMGSIMIILI